MRNLRFVTDQCWIRETAAILDIHCKKNKGLKLNESFQLSHTTPQTVTQSSDYIAFSPDNDVFVEDVEEEDSIKDVEEDNDQRA